MGRDLLESRVPIDLRISYMQGQTNQTFCDYRATVVIKLAAIILVIYR